MTKSQSYSAAIKRVGIVTIIWNIVLTVIKLAVGIVGQSSAMISDAVHSGSDIFTTVIVMIGAKISGKESDEKHSYGHERFESVASIFLGILLGATAIGIGYGGIKTIIAFHPSTYMPGKYTYLALLGAILSIVLKGWMYLYTIKTANKIHSTSLKADAWHHLSDSLSSIGSMLGIIGLMIGKGWEILDPIAAIIICVVILKVAFDIIKSALDQLVDKSVSKETAEQMMFDIVLQDGVQKIKSFQSRQFGNRIYLDIEIYVPNTLSLVEADDIAEKVHHFLEQKYTQIKHCSICTKPSVEGENVNYSKDDRA